MIVTSIILNITFTKDVGIPDASIDVWECAYQDLVFEIRIAYMADQRASTEQAHLDYKTTKGLLGKG